MHDIQNLDRRGIPGGFVCSEAFQEAAEAQSKSLAFNPAVVWVPHPIQNRTETELAGLAEAAMAEILDMISPQKATQ